MKRFIKLNFYQIYILKKKFTYDNISGLIISMINKLIRLTKSLN